MSAEFYERQLEILERISGKLSCAGYQIECGKTSRAIINIGSEEETILCWALQSYKEELVKSISKESEKSACNIV